MNNIDIRSFCKTFQEQEARSACWSIPSTDENINHTIFLYLYKGNGAFCIILLPIQRLISKESCCRCIILSHMPPKTSCSIRVLFATFVKRTSSYKGQKLSSCSNIISRFIHREDDRRMYFLHLQVAIGSCALRVYGLSKTAALFREKWD